MPGRLSRSLRTVGAKAKAALSERDALLGAGREALVVWGRDGSGPFTYNGGDELLQSCLRGAEALALSGAIDGLADRGSGFSLTVHDPHGRLFVARGRAVGGMAAVWLEEPQLPAMETGADYKAILGRAAHSRLAARQGPGPDLGQPRLPERRRRERPGNGAARAIGAGQG